MVKEQPIGSILLADCGTVMTKAVLLYRFVARGEAPTTAEYPCCDVAAGIRHAVEQISEVTGRRSIRCPRWLAEGYHSDFRGLF